MTNTQFNIKKISLSIAILYCFVGFLWILFSDSMVMNLFDNAEMITLIQTYKGWGYVFVTGILLYLLTYKLFDNYNM